MLAKLAPELPGGGGFLCQPKWDGFRAIVFRGGDDVYIQSRDLKPLDSYFPELHDALLVFGTDVCERFTPREVLLYSAPGAIWFPSRGC